MSTPKPLSPAVQTVRQFPDARKMVPIDADRLALALCPHRCHASQTCSDCRRDSANHCRELAAILREHHGGSSQVADWLDGVGNG
jgi:hypothetical protein